MRVTPTVSVWLLLAACGPKRSVPTPARAPAVVLVPIDGIRSDYLDRPETVELQSIARQGSRLMASLLRLRPAPNDGSLDTIGVVLKTVSSKQ